MASPTQVLNSPLNNSKSKYQYSFPRSPRFKKIKPHCETDFYNLSQTNYKRSTAFGYGNKFDFTKSTANSQIYYDLESSFTSNKRQGKGQTFGLSRSQFKNYIPFNSNPGPGQYHQFGRNPARSYSIRPRTQSPWIPNFLNESLQSDMPGPGTYNNNQINGDGRQTQSKFRSTENIVSISNHAKRFKTESQLNPGPGQYNPIVQKPKVQCRFGSAKRTCFIDQVVKDAERKHVPGPGNYPQQSEFACVLRSRPHTAKR